MTLQDDWRAVRDDAIGMETDPDIDLVDVWMVSVAIRRAASYDLFQEFVVNHCTDKSGVFAPMSLDQLANGPSYINLGAWIGDQTDALIFIALGAHHRFWDVITPATLGLTREDESARNLAGRGFVMNAGVNAEKLAELRALQVTQL